MANFDKWLAREFVQGVVRSTIARGIDSATRLQQFRTLQKATAVMTQDVAIARTAEQLVLAIDLSLKELTETNS